MSSTTGAASAMPVVMRGFACCVNAGSSRRGRNARFDWIARHLGGGQELKKPLLSNTLNRFMRKRWNYGHNFAFLLDSQAISP